MNIEKYKPTKKFDECIINTGVCVICHSQDYVNDDFVCVDCYIQAIEYIYFNSI